MIISLQFAARKRYITMIIMQTTEKYPFLFDAETAMQPKIPGEMYIQYSPTGDAYLGENKIRIIIGYLSLGA